MSPAISRKDRPDGEPCDKSFCPPARRVVPDNSHECHRANRDRGSGVRRFPLDRSSDRPADENSEAPIDLGVPDRHERARDLRPKSAPVRAFRFPPTPRTKLQAANISAVEHLRGYRGPCKLANHFLLVSAPPRLKI